jgi:hypothetical protein
MTQDTNDKIICHFLILNMFVVVPMMSQCTYTVLPSYWVARGTRVTSRLSERNAGVGGVGTETHISLGNCTTAAFVVLCNKKT